MAIDVSITRSDNKINIDVVFQQKVSKKVVDVATFEFSHPIADVRKLDWPATAFSGYLSTYKRQVQSKLKSLDSKIKGTVRAEITDLNIRWNAQRARYPRTKAGRAALKKWYARQAEKVVTKLVTEFETTLKKKVDTQVFAARDAAQKELLRANPQWEKDMRGVAGKWFSATIVVGKLIALFPIEAPAAGVEAAVDTAGEVAGAGAAANTSLGKIKGAYKAYSQALRKRPARLADTFKEALGGVSSALTQLEELEAAIHSMTDEIETLEKMAERGWKTGTRQKRLAARKKALEQKLTPADLEEIHEALAKADESMKTNARKFARLDFKGFDGVLKEIATQT
ncbi:MAG: hypothetical protein AAF409_03915 [Pseudomonadota bacterium]